MKKILTVSLFAMMAVGAANADIASTDYVGGLTGSVVFTSDLLSGKNLTEAAVALEGQLGTLTGNNSTLEGRIEAAENAASANADAIEAMDAAYKAADTATLNSAKSYADDLASNYDASGSAAQALVDAKAYADAEDKKIEDTIGEVADDKTVVQMIAEAQSAATYNDAEVRGLISGNTSAIEALGTAYQAADTATLNSAKSYADSLARNYDASGSAAQALVDAKAYADAEDKKIEDTIGEVAEGKTVVEMISDAKTAATYNDTEVRGLISGNTEAIADMDAAYKAADTALETNLKAYADTAEADAIAAAKTAGDAAYDSKGSAAQALTDAKTFTTEQIEALSELANFPVECATAKCALTNNGTTLSWEVVR